MHGCYDDITMEVLPIIFVMIPLVAFFSYSIWKHDSAQNGTKVMVSYCYYMYVNDDWNMISSVILLWTWTLQTYISCMMLDSIKFWISNSLKSFLQVHPIFYLAFSHLFIKIPTLNLDSSCINKQNLSLIQKYLKSTLN